MGKNELIKNKLISACSSAQCTTEILAILKGINGEAYASGCNHVEALYDYSYGNQREVVQYASNYLVLVTNAIDALTCINVIKSSIKSAKQFNDIFTREVERAVFNIKKYALKCEENYLAN